MALQPVPVVKKVTFGKIHAIIHEIVRHIDRDGNYVYRCTYHLTDYSVTPPIKTDTAWCFFKEPEITPEERRGKTLEQIRKLWAKKFIQNLKGALNEAVKQYKANRDVFRL